MTIEEKQILNIVDACWDLGVVLDKCKLLH